MLKSLSVFIAIFGISGILFGALAAHAGLTPQASGFVQTALDYHLVHAASLFSGVIALSLWPVETTAHKRMRFALIFWVLGIICFCGGLYVQAFTGIDVGKVIPSGGFAFMFGWLFAGWSLIGVSSRAE